jgi:mannose-1-phosphate guanylyltransferase
VLVGGEGTRLRPLTNTIPKQLLPVVEQTMIERVLAHLAAHGVDEALLSLGYRPDAFRSAFPEDHASGLRLSYAVEPAPLDTAGAIAFAAAHGGIDDTFLVVNGDVLTDLDVSALVGFHRQRRAEASISLTPVDDPSRFGVVPIDDEGRVLAFIEKPDPGRAPTNLINAGTYVLEPSVLERIPTGRRVSIERETFPALVAEGRLYAQASDAPWVDAGTPATYLAANLVYAVDGAVVGSDVVIGAGAVVERSVLMDRAEVCERAVVIDSLIGPGARVGTGACLTDLTVVGEDVAVEAGAVIAGGRLPAPS